MKTNLHHESGRKKTPVCEHLLTSADIGGKTRYASINPTANARPRLDERSPNRCIPPSEYAHSASLPRFRPALSFATRFRGNYPHLGCQHRKNAGIEAALRDCLSGSRCGFVRRPMAISPAHRDSIHPLPGTASATQPFSRGLCDQAGGSRVRC